MIAWLSWVAFAALLLAWPGAGHADSAAGEFAATQLAYAEATLERAEEARRSGDMELAARLAAMAQLDARLAWSMSESPHLRQAAARVSRAAGLLRSNLVIGQVAPN